MSGNIYVFDEVVLRRADYELANNEVILPGITEKQRDFASICIKSGTNMVLRMLIDCFGEEQTTIAMEELGFLDEELGKEAIAEVNMPGVYPVASPDSYRELEMGRDLGSRVDGGVARVGKAEHQTKEKMYQRALRKAGTKKSRERYGAYVKTLETSASLSDASNGTKGEEQ